MTTTDHPTTTERERDLATDTSLVRTNLDKAEADQADDEVAS